MRILVAGLVMAAVCVVALPGSSGDERGAVQREDAPRAGADEVATPRPARRDSAPRRDVPRSACPAGVAGCRAVRGTVVFVERVDPDGDGDLHVVLSAGSVTGPGFTAVDVPRGRRPPRDPRVGDRASAAGPVQTGSYGQSQIHALAFRVRAQR